MAQECGYCMASSAGHGSDGSNGSSDSSPWVSIPLSDLTLMLLVANLANSK